MTLLCYFHLSKIKIIFLDVLGRPLTFSEYGIEGWEMCSAVHQSPWISNLNFSRMWREKDREKRAVWTSHLLYLSLLVPAHFRSAPPSHPTPSLFYIYCKILHNVANFFSVSSGSHHLGSPVSHLPYCLLFSQGSCSPPLCVPLHKYTLYIMALWSL